MIVVYLTLSACALAAMLLVLRYDLYEREPWPMLLLAAGAGGALMWSLGFLEDWTLDRVAGPGAGAATMAIIAAVEEEMGRLFVVAVIAVLLPFQLNDPIDGLIYGSIVGLGMAIEESRAVLWSNGAPDGLLPASEPVRLLGHLVLGGITGFAVGMARFGRKRWLAALAACLSGSIGIHGLWDWIAFTAADRGVMTSAQTTAAVILMLSGMVIYGGLVVTGSRWSRGMFAAGSEATLWGWPFRARAPR